MCFHLLDRPMSLQVPVSGRSIRAGRAPSAVPVSSLRGAALARRLSRELAGSRAERSGVPQQRAAEQRRSLPPSVSPSSPSSPRPVPSRPSVRPSAPPPRQRGSERPGGACAAGGMRWEGKVSF